MDILREKPFHRKYSKLVLRANIAPVRKIDLNPDELADALLSRGPGHRVSLLDSCGVGHLGSHLMITGTDPGETLELFGPDPHETLAEFEALLGSGRPVIFTLGYELGLALNGVRSKHQEQANEPFIYAAAFDSLAVHDYLTGETAVRGEPDAIDRLINLLNAQGSGTDAGRTVQKTHSDFTPAEYAAAVIEIQERIRAGDTYQANLTRRITADLPDSLLPAHIFRRIRNNHPAPFAAYIERPASTVISASPERFFRIENGKISTSPIKGTRPRGSSPEEDLMFRDELLKSQKDRAENTMIVDLLRNDLGRVCKYGSVRVERLCEIEEHPSLFHLVSTIKGDLIPEISVSDVIRALFPCGSITGAPKISTMRIIDEIERSPRGLSMGAIGIYMPASFGMGEFIDTSVAIRTMTVRGRTAEFNVGGGIVIDSDPVSEYEETVTKSLALLSALGV